MLSFYDHRINQPNVISKLYDKESKWTNISLKQGDNLFENLKEDLYDINVEIGSGVSSFSIGARGAIIHYNAAKNLLSCGGPTIENSIKTDNEEADDNLVKNLKNNLGEASLFPGKGVVKLRILIDRTSVEVFSQIIFSTITCIYM